MTIEADRAEGGRRPRTAQPSRGQRRFSTVLRLVAARAGDHVTLQQLADAFAERAFGAFLFIFGILNAVPSPPGTTSVLGIPLVFVATQLTLGRRSLWLPARLRDRQIAVRHLRRVTARVFPWLRRVERLLAPRLGFVFSRLGMRAIGAICLFLSLLVLAPIPLANMGPSLSICCFALAMLARDGVFVLVGILAAIISLAFVAFVYGSVLAWLWNWVS